MSNQEPVFRTIVLSGPMTLYESSDIRDQLRSALEEGQPLRLDLETTGPWDLSGLQLLASAVASGRKLDVLVRFDHVPRVCAEVAERAGLGAWLAERTESFL
ncbi:MAG TPA: STAS domain-containing protein [Isosphaeraceae bacterium]|jgi:ABC-type transporter Mla MlaB component|nr:STAS domain-containing protein [Isosphaeraceae bacterium]